MRLKMIGRLFIIFPLLIWIITDQTLGQPNESVPSIILGGIENVASSATNFLSRVVKRQKDLLHRMTDTATDYIVSAVERPRNLLINATRATTGIIDSAASKGLEFKLRRFIEKFRSRMRYGIPELDIPPLEPFNLDGIRIDTDNPEIGNVSAVITDLTLYGLSSFLIESAKLSLIGPTISVNLLFPELYATGNYNISGILGHMFALFGSGPFKATIYEFRLKVTVVVGYSRGLYIKDFDFDFTLTSVLFDIENFMGGDEIGRIMNKVFQELTPQVIEIIKPDILPGIKSYVASRVNETIQHLTMRDLFNILLGENEIRDIAHLIIP
ncbi:PREDICTED: uncharacterized protein LOC106787721 isoform X1 [Polistes canadensis]|uniref:uncharacterized protein LOC106787721 isoform X1 n=1 Tax=Polistes canadensis TaxID=91411 RepID=UPI000718BA63|nr:PREDICTED: uncharacterized protein LOC106787721 isoform X1 [Polistes canadensis]